MKINVPLETALKMLESLLSQIPYLEEKDELSPEYQEWEAELKSSIEEIYGDWRRNSLKTIYYILNPVMMMKGLERDDIKLNKAQSKLKQLEVQLRGLYSSLSIRSNFSKENNSPRQIPVLEDIFLNFPRFIRQLKVRYNKRGALINELNDEYDVQDVVHALQLLHYDDVRAEEYCLSYAGGASRMDFLIKDEKIGIEIKMTNGKLKDKEIGDQLAIDKERYRSHPDCRTLICFVYDPKRLLRNPSGLAKDLSSNENDFTVRVIIVS